MTTTDEYEGIGKFIFTAARFGAGMPDVYNWMADELGVARPPADDDFNPRALFAAFFARHASDEAMQASLDGFVESIRNRRA